MKYRVFSLFIVLITIGSINPAWGQCVQGDVSVQYSISSSRKPTDRTNDVVMESDPKCSGNASVTTGVQEYRGDSSNRQQHRRVRQVQQGGQGNPSGIDGTTVQIRSNVQEDFYLPSPPRQK